MCEQADTDDDAKSAFSARGHSVLQSGGDMTPGVARRCFFWAAGAALVLVLVWNEGVPAAFGSPLGPGSTTRGDANPPVQGGDPNQAPAPPNTATFTPTNTSTGTPANSPTITPTGTVTPNCTQHYTITRISSGTVVSGTTFVTNSDCDDCRVLINLPFTYYFYDQPFNTVNATSNGLLGFTGSVDYGYVNTCIPDPLVTTNVIYAYWRDLDMDSMLEQCIDLGCGVYTSVSGSAPNRIFNIEWRAVGLAGPNPFMPIYFEVRLYEGQQKWDIVYSHVDPSDYQHATIGAQKDSTGVVYAQYQCPGSPASLNDGDMLTFSYGYVCPTATPTGEPTFTPTGGPSSTPANSATSTSMGTATFSP